MIETQLEATRIVLEVLSGRSLTPVLTESRARIGDSTWGALQNVAYGVFRQLGLLRSILGALLARPLTDRDVEALLLVALYQLQFTVAAPYAVVDQAVQASSRLGKGAAKGLVNAVLRNFLRRRDGLLDQAKRSESARWSYPQWWIDELRHAYPAQYAGILEQGNQHPPMTLRVNLRRIARDDYQQLLRDEDVAAEAVGPAALMLVHPIGVERLPGFGEGLVSVQDLSAQYVPALLDLADGQRVLDACAAPGGKTAHLLETAAIEVTALDSDAQRLQRVRDTLARLQLTADKLLAADAAQTAAWWNGRPFDRILLDAPCTASGIVRRHPDIKWLRRAADVQTMAQQQRALLDALWHTLAAGGKLLYATCSVFAAENAEQISTFLESHPEATLLPLSGIPASAAGERIAGQILPDTRHDGFFYALLQKP